LEVTGWRVDGSNGAAKILDINTSTLGSRMKKLGIKRE
jgi:transcriptional regulator with GAF, ATPase, and Fis domain